jgi:hypothetical protein
MILSVEALKRIINSNDKDEQLVMKMEAIEAVIRSYTNNNFQQRGIRFRGSSEGSGVYGAPRFFSEGDTVQISSQYGVNDGLYEVVGVYADHLELDRPLMAVDDNLVTKVSYPADVVQCALDLFSWKQSMGAKVGVKSETLSRHSVTYEDSATLFMGYPVGILKGLDLHRKARC